MTSRRLAPPFAVLLIILLASAARAAPPLVLQSGVDKYPLAGHMSYLTDPGGKLKMDDILRPDIQAEFQPNKEGRENFGRNPAVFWFKLVLQNPSDREQKFLLEEGFPHIDFLDFYAFENGRKVAYLKAGDQLPYRQREIDYRNFLFPITIPAKATFEVYIAAQTEGGMQVPFTLWRAEALLERVNEEQTFLGLYFGILGAMALYNLFLFIFLGDRTYLYYVLFVSSMFLQQLGLSRMDMEYLWPNLTYWANTSHIASYCASFFFAAVFCRSFLNTRDNARWTDRILLFMMGVCVVAGVLALLDYRGISIFIIMYVIAGFEPFILLAAGVICWARGHKVARYYTVAWTILVITAFINNLRSIGLIEPTFFSYYVSHFGSAIEAVLLSIALADRINMIKSETIEAKERAIVAEKALTTELEKQVAERTMALEMANRELEKQSNTDGLTGVFNRRYFDNRLASEWNRHERNQRPLSVLMADIDFFKQFNDTYGHPAGDACLQAVAKALDASSQRPHDIIARYGGEEFSVLLPETEIRGAYTVAQAMKKAVEDLCIPHDGNDASPLVSLSFGISTVTPNKEVDSAQLVALADEALYQSKRTGRNRITSQEYPSSERPPARP